MRGLNLFGVCLTLAILTHVGQAQAQVPTVTSINPTSGPSTGGQAVVINGTNFPGGGGVLAGTVYFGANPSPSVVYAGPTLISAVTPPGTGLVDVTVDTAGGTSDPSGAVNDYLYISPATIPTLGEWALMALIAMLGVAGFAVVRRRFA